MSLRHTRLDVLLNNVGEFWATRHTSVDGLEHTFAVNHLAPFLLTNLLLDRLRASAPARVVTVSSGAQAMGSIDMDDLQGGRDYSGQRAYNQSQRANVMFTYELARRLQGSGVTANAVHPGVVRTNFGREDSTGWMRLMLPVIRPFMKSPERGAATSVAFASSPEVERVTGRYFANLEAQDLVHGLAGPHGRGPAVGRLRGAGRPLTGSPATPDIAAISGVSLPRRRLLRPVAQDPRSREEHPERSRHRGDADRLMARCRLPGWVVPGRTLGRHAVKMSGWRRCGALRGGGLSAADSWPPAPAAPVAAGATGSTSASTPSRSRATRR